MFILITKDVLKQDLGNVTLYFGIEEVEQASAAASHEINSTVRTYLKLPEATGDRCSKKFGVLKMAVS